MVQKPIGFVTTEQKLNKLTADDYRSLSEFRYQIRRFFHFSEQAALAAGLSPQQHQLLLALKGLPEGLEPNIGEVAKRLLIRHHSAVGLAERLVLNGFIRKRQSREDRRHVLLEITAKGETILQKLSISHRGQIEFVDAGLIQALDKRIKSFTEPHAKHYANKEKSRRSG
jgi:DNA-binding MarR family transcriptional regulator